MLFTAFGVAGVIGPILGGKIRDSFGAYTHSYTISAIMLLLGAVLAFMVKAPEAEPTPPSSSPPGGQKSVGQAEAIRK
jgi:OFA family oxalate/formate antiporter-like MFS transporter